MNLPVGLDEHYIVKHPTQHFRCQKCGQVGESCADIRQMSCTVNFMADVVEHDGENQAAEENLLQSLQDEVLAMELLEEEMALLEANEMLAALELEESQRMDLEEKSLQTALLDSMSQKGDRPPCPIIRAADVSALEDMQKLHDMGYSKENAIWAVRVSHDLKEAEDRAAGRANAEAAFELRNTKPKAEEMLPPNTTVKKAPVQSSLSAYSCDACLSKFMTQLCMYTCDQALTWLRLCHWILNPLTPWSMQLVRMLPMRMLRSHRRQQKRL